jgi:hypothetical protein
MDGNKRFYFSKRKAECRYYAMRKGMNARLLVKGGIISATFF